MSINLIRVWITMFIKVSYGCPVTLMESDVGIVGGGVVGLCLARRLGERGISSTVYEAGRSVGAGADRASGILSKSGLEGLGIDYKGSVVNELRGAVFHVGGRAFTVRSRETKAYVLDRTRLAVDCAKGAAEAGADIRLGSRLAAEEARGLSARHRVVVGADGAVSSVARAFGFPHIARRVLTYKAVFGGADIPDPGMVGLHFDNRITRGFFGWTAPYSGSELEVAVGIEDRGRANAKRAFDAFLGNADVGREVSGGRMVREDASLIPLAIRSKTVIGNVLLVGDAAGQVKATTGGGIIFGVGCAGIAAESIEEHLRKGRGLSSYEALWRRRYGADLTLHRLLHGYYAGIGKSGLSMALSLMKSLGAERLLSMYGDMDSPSRTIRGVVFRKAQSGAAVRP